MNEQRYEKGGSAGSKGSQFQVHLLAVFLLNALRMRLPNWRLSTEDKRAGKFDDVVLEWSEGAVLLQAKHKENKKRITVEQLMSTSSKNDDFSIPKYFLSYQEIKDKFPTLKKAVICTNASVNERAVKFLNSQTDSSDSVLFCEGDTCPFYTLKDDFLSELKDIIKTYYIQNYRGGEVDDTVITDENLKTFQKHFQIYFDYPSENDLKEIAAKLLNGTSWCTKASASEIYSKVMDWFQQRDGIFFTELRVRAMVSEIRREKYWQSLKQYDVCFANNDLNFADSNRRYHFITDDSNLLQEIRIWQALRGIENKVLYIHPDDSMTDKKQMIEVFGLLNYTFLIIIQPNESVGMQMWDQIEEILNKFAYKNVVLLTGRDNKFLRRIQSGNNHFDVIKEIPTFEDISKETRDRLLKVKNILFQGNFVSLEDLFAPRSLQDYKTSLGSEILERLVAGEKIRVGSELRGLEEEVKRSYISRNFIRNNENRHEGNIFEANDKLILIADSAGTGKTTTLTKLAMLIKESNPHLWVLKIVLDSYSKFFRESLRKHKSTIDIMELLNSQGTTKIINQLDRLVFSVDKKVVLLLDGIDEISPYYTQLVESLLVKCLRAPNIFKIFATTRTHLAENLEEKFKVKSFLLEPFSERNQIDFLNSYWLHNLGQADRQKCEQYARCLVRKMSSWINSDFDEENNFTAIPLQVNMLAEIFQENGRSEGLIDWEGCMEFVNSDSPVPKLPEKFDLTRLYQLFIEKKRDVFIDKLNPSGTAGVEQALLDDFEESMAFHRKFALTVIVDDEMLINSFSCYKEDEKNYIQAALNIGIIQEIDNSLNFIHRTFAEYFFAQCLLIELQCYNQNTTFQKFLIDEMLLSSTFELICTFFDGLLQDCVDSLPRDIFQNYQCLSYNIDLSSRHSVSVVHVLSERGLVAILQLLLRSVDFKIIKDKETSVKELRQQISCKNTAAGTHYFGNRLNILQLLFQWGGVNIRDESDSTPLRLAAGRGHLRMVQFLVDQGASINITCNGKWTPLYEAVSHGHMDIVGFLVEQGADIIRNVRQGGNELYAAISGNHVPIAKYLLENILEDVILECGLDAEYAMIPFAAAYLGRIDVLTFLTEWGMNVNTKIENKQSLIFGAAMGGQLKIVKYLVDQGANINNADIDNNTVLHLISDNPSLIHVAKFFVDSGIDVDVENNRGMTALYVAATAGTRDMAELLIKGGADVNSTNKRQGSFALHMAAVNSHLTTVELLVQHGADINAQSGHTALHLCSKNDHLDTVKCLVKLGADVTVKDIYGYTALHRALLKLQLDCAKYLAECNIDVDTRDDEGQTVLHLLVSMKVRHLDIYFRQVADHLEFHKFVLPRLDIVKRLVARGANFNITNDEGQTVLYFAILNIGVIGSVYSCDQCLAIVNFLIEQGAAIDTDNSKGDVVVRLAKDIQTTRLCDGQSLETIFQLPVFDLIPRCVFLDRKNVTPYNS